MVVIASKADKYNKNQSPILVPRNFKTPMETIATVTAVHRYIVSTSAVPAAAVAVPVR
jgi:hypothetical protein